MNKSGVVSEPNHWRRALLKTSAASLAPAALLASGKSCAAWALMLPQASAQEDTGTKDAPLDWRENLLARPRIINARRQSTGEVEMIAYWTPQDGILRDGYIKACMMLRDVSANKVRLIDVRLLDLLCGVQYWLAFYGHTTTLEILSGFRTRDTNDRLEGAAKNSMHMEGRAVDFRIFGMPTAVLGTMVSAFTAGGIGFYLDKGFIHADTGRVRHWISSGKR